MLLKSQTLMALKARALVLFHLLVWSLLGTFSVSYGTESDISCLKSIRDSLKDPLNLLTSSWTFDNLIEGSICKELENLDLSGNELAGSIPHDINEILPSITMLNLSDNNFSGEIPSSIGNCAYLQVLELDKNRLTGRISQQLSQLSRLRIFSVTNNLLSGPVPEFVNNINVTRESYVNNSGLCGGPLEYCKKHRWEFEVSFKSGFVISYVIFASLYTAFFMYYFNHGFGSKKRGLKKRNHESMPTTMTAVKARRKNRTEPYYVSQFPAEEHQQERSKEFFIVEGIVANISFARLSEATNNFSANNVIGSGKMGTVYKAMLLDGTILAVKRLQASQHYENQLISEVMTLGRLRHNNLVPLMGFCLEMQEAVLVYKYMSNGSLHDWLSAVEDKGKTLEWSLRVKIVVGIARGLAWLHHRSDFRIVHLDISSKCILLDQKFEPKISNFGRTISRSFAIDSESGEMEMIKKDVYSFGIVLLELLTVAKGYDGEIFQFLKIACNCVQPCPDQRPTMLEVCDTLRAIRERYGLTVKDDYELLRQPEIAAAITTEHEIIEVKSQ
uniref:Protein kinase domain-containing protein n=1 Tax=Fagus sylvatica TaxID=28930 RepID=A0A2N9FYS5_FAGSY